MPTNDREAIVALNYVVRHLREKTHGCRTWDELGTAKYLGEMKAAGWGFAAMVEQALRRATDAEARTPATLLHKVASAPLPSEQPKAAADGIRPGEECPKHVAQRAETCVWCVRGVRAWDEVAEPDPPAPTLPPVGEVRPGLAKRLAGLGGGS